MKRAMLVLGMLLLVGCHKHSTVVQPRTVLTCAPCSGVGLPLTISTPLPVPISAIVNHRLCFEQEEQSRCWYDCPGPLEETVWHGDTICAIEEAP